MLSRFFNRLWLLRNRGSSEGVDFLSPFRNKSPSPHETRGDCKWFSCHSYDTFVLGGEGGGGGGRGFILETMIIFPNPLQ